MSDYHKCKLIFEAHELALHQRLVVIPLLSPVPFSLLRSVPRDTLKREAQSPFWCSPVLKNLNKERRLEVQLSLLRLRRLTLVQI